MAPREATDDGLAARFWVGSLRRIAQRRSVILGYHGIGTAQRRDDVFRLLVSPAQFTLHLRLLSAAGFRFVTVAELADQLGADAPPPGLAAISFDDGMRDNFTTALPILRRLGIRATVYVAAGLIGGYSPWIATGPAAEILREDEIRGLADEGWEIGAHTMTHPDMSVLDYEQCTAEIERGRETLEEITGQQTLTFAYPFGRYGPEAIAAVRTAGFRAAVTIGSGSWSRLELTRAMISAGDPIGLVMLKLTDRYEPLVSSPPLRFVRRASKHLRSAIANRPHGDDPRPPGPPAY
ncbi:MAG TPA: polysaccharide deacetylase family protein [Solirubrobacteraceae bacterium]|nr:polysaccharide deacetylase family protein [Solirubrobacteraceae bacterium]